MTDKNFSVCLNPRKGRGERRFILKRCASPYEDIIVWSGDTEEEARNWLREHEPTEQRSIPWLAIAILVIAVIVIGRLL